MLHGGSTPSFMYNTTIVLMAALVDNCTCLGLCHISDTRPLDVAGSRQDLWLCTAMEEARSCSLGYRSKARALVHRCWTILTMPSDNSVQRGCKGHLVL